MNRPDTFQGRIELLHEAAGHNHRALGRWLGISDITVGAWLAGQAPKNQKILQACGISGLSVDWLRNGVGDTKTEVGKYREVTPDEAQTARIAEGAPPTHRQAINHVLKHGSDAQRAELGKKAVELAEKMGRARSVLRGMPPAPGTQRSQGDSK